MIELDVVILLYVLHQVHDLLLIGIHCLPKFILLPQVLIPQIVQSVIIDFEQTLDALLMLVQLLAHVLTFGDIRVLKLDYIFLNLSAGLSKHIIIMPLMGG